MRKEEEMRTRGGRGEDARSGRGEEKGMPTVISSLQVEYYFSQQFQDCSVEDILAHWDLRRQISDPNNSSTLDQFQQLAELQQRTSSRKCTYALVRYYKAYEPGGQKSSEWLYDRDPLSMESIVAVHRIAARFVRLPYQHGDITTFRICRIPRRLGLQA
jgi:hypothetical protein